MVKQKRNLIDFRIFSTVIYDFAVISTALILGYLVYNFNNLTIIEKVSWLFTSLFLLFWSALIKERIYASQENPSRLKDLLLFRK